MKKITFCLFVILFFNRPVLSQEMDESWLNFWLGEWSLTWQSEGEDFKGENIISKILDDKIVQENFINLNNGYMGMSVSTYNPIAKKWFQTWVDSEGSYLTFTSDMEGDSKIFKTQVVERNGNKYQQRMVFKNIEKDSFNWYWEATTDGGETWTLNWEIQYKRK